jgi:hypothetical protein
MSLVIQRLRNTTMWTPPLQCCDLPDVYVNVSMTVTDI